jgi:hypothetical protein
LGFFKKKILLYIYREKHDPPPPLGEANFDPALLFEKLGRHFFLSVAMATRVLHGIKIL